MYICNCNGITQRQVKAARDAGATKWTDVHTHFGCRPQCGSCGIEMSACLRDGEQPGPQAHFSAALAKA